MKKGDFEINTLGMWILAIIFLFIGLSLTVVLLKENGSNLILNFFSIFGGYMNLGKIASIILVILALFATFGIFYSFYNPLKIECIGGEFRDECKSKEEIIAGTDGSPSSGM